MRTEINLQTGEVTEHEDAPVSSADTTPTVPQAVTMRQARLALYQAGLIDDVNAAVAQAGATAQIEWEYAATIERNSSLVAAMAVSLSLSTKQLDDLFKEAAHL